MKLTNHGEAAAAAGSSTARPVSVLAKVSRFCLVFLVGSSPAFAAEAPSDEALLKVAANLDKLTKVTRQRVAIRPTFAALCKSAPVSGQGLKPRNHTELVGKRDAAILIYVTPAGAPAFNVRRARFPVGTVVLKQKFEKMTSKEAQFYTGMLKRETGYNPDCGDWEFFTMNGDARAITARGRMESCVDCHRQYSETDFITKSHR